MSPCLQRSRENFRSFAAQTSVKAISFITNAEGPLEVIFWISIVLICTCLTVWTVTDTVMQYQSGKTLSKVTVQSRNRITFPSPTLCVELKIASIEEFQEDIEIDTIEDFLAIYNNMSLGDLSRLSLLIQSTLKAIVDVVKLENAVTTNETVVANQSKSILTDQLIKSDLNLSQLIKVVGSIVCNQMKIFTSTTSQPNRTNPCVPENILWLGPTPFDVSRNHLCLNLSHPNWLQFDFAVTKTSTLEMAIADPNVSVTLDFNNNRLFSRETQNVLQIPVGNWTRVGLSIDGHYKNIYKRYVCARTTPFTDCYGYCLADYLLNLCNCWPVSWMGLPRTRAHQIKAEECDYGSRNGTTSACYLALANKTAALSTCQLTCTEKCEFDIIGLKQKNVAVQDSTVVSLFDQSHILLTFEEFLAISDKQFISYLGGSLSIYIGASFIALLHAIVFILKKCCGQHKVVEAAPNQIQLKPMWEKDEKFDSYVREKFRDLLIEKLADTQKMNNFIVDSIEV